MQDLKDEKLEDVNEGKKEKLKDHLSNLADHAEELFNTFKSLTVLKITEKVVTAASRAIGAIAVVFFSFFLLLFGSIALAFWLGQLVNSTAGGFLLVALLYGIAMGVVLALRKTVIFPYFRNRIIKGIYEDKQ